MKKFVIMVLDTETCPIVQTEKVNAHNMLTYDLGYSIIDLKHNVYIERSFVVADIFFGEENKMQSGYYANKLPQYRQDIARGKRLMRTWEEVREIVQEDIKNFGVNIICAHNARFDYTTLNKTKQWVNGDYMIPKIEWWDSMKMAKTTICQKTSYKKFCQENNFMTKHKTPRVQMKAEVIYKYLTNNLEFVESHTGLEDTKIEREIVWACFDMHKPMERKLWKD